ncbi:MAG TPA: cation:proton antiporter [Flavipsychrobacter sp.]|nr:cation:proton antiporter [Flavipsychrobacter sp.]
MGHLPKLIEDLALILMTGAFTTLIFKRIKQPLVLGYIIAGFLVGPHLSITPTVADRENVKTLAEIGVIFLLFSLGLEFSFKKLMRVGGTASITAFVEIIFITIMGYFTGKLMGWSTMDSLFLGGMLASSSTTIIIRAFDELGVKTQQYARIVFGVLVVEDIVVILLMVLLSTMAVSQAFEGMELLMTVLKLLFFLALWFIMGIFLLPSFLKRNRKLMDDENLLILSIGLCLGMVVLATQVGFSAELGAFIMGSIIAETTSAEKVEHVIKPVKDLFGAVFFISVGMLIDPQTIMEYKWPVIIVTFLTLFGKLFSTTLGAVLSGQPLKQSVQVGMSMAQIGEFAFIVATLGLSLGVISPFLFPVAVGASAITTFTTPYLIKFSEPAYRVLVKILPEKLITALNNYSLSTQNIGTESHWKNVLGAYMKIVATNGILLLGLVLLTIRFLVPFLQDRIENQMIVSTTALIIALIVAAPFLWALMAKRPDTISYRALWLDKKYNRGPMLMLEVLRFLVGIAFIGLLVDRLFSASIAILFVLPATVIILYLFSKRLQQFYKHIETRFLSNLNARESAAASKDALAAEMLQSNEQLQTELTPWHAYITDAEVNPHATFVGKTLSELAWREQYGINIAYIKRGDKIIHAPGRHNKLLPFDTVGIIATEEQMHMFRSVFEAVEVLETQLTDVRDIVLQKIKVDDYTQLAGKTIRESGVRELTNGLIIGIERKNIRILNPDSVTLFERNDIVWIVGDRKRIQNLVKGKI